MESFRTFQKFTRINHDVVQAAAKGGNPFHMNDLLNGIPLDRTLHVEGLVHTAYNTRVAARLQEIVTRNGSNLTSTIAKQELETLINNIRAAINAHPGVNLNNIPF